MEDVITAEEIKKEQEEEIEDEAKGGLPYTKVKEVFQKVINESVITKENVEDFIFDINLKELLINSGMIIGEYRIPEYLTCNKLFRQLCYKKVGIEKEDNSQMEEI